MRLASVGQSNPPSASHRQPAPLSRVTNAGWVRPVMATCLLVVFTGCQDPLPPVTSLNGTISINDQPLSRGNIALLHESGAEVAAPIGPAGAFHFQEILVGKHRIKIIPTSLEEEESLSNAKDPPARLQYPKRYLKYLSSGLQHEVIPGAPLHLNLKSHSNATGS